MCMETPLTPLFRKACLVAFSDKALGGLKILPPSNRVPPSMHVVTCVRQFLWSNLMRTAIAPTSITMTTYAGIAVAASSLLLDLILELVDLGIAFVVDL